MAYLRGFTEIGMKPTTEYNLEHSSFKVFDLFAHEASR